MKESIPARLHVLFARNANYAVIIRRGPAKHVCTIGWDMKKNFTLGQWIYGRIYEQRCDLSPDGRYLIYFALNGRWESETKGTYTALSRTPYLKAIGLWGDGSTWHGGGLFISNTEYWINRGYGNVQLKSPSRLKHVAQLPSGVRTGRIYFYRLIRDGWKSIDGKGSTQRFTKKIGSGWFLVKHFLYSNGTPGKGAYFEKHELHNSSTNEKLLFPSWEWADIKKGKLYWAEKGKLFTGLVTEKGLDNVKELHDFNDMEFKPVKAPY